METVQQIFENNYFISAVISWFLAQFIKTVIEISKRGKLRTSNLFMRALFGTGGMPSSHSASVTAIAVGIGIKEGFGSPLFAFATIFTLIVIRDATGVRLSAGKQAQVVNELVAMHNSDNSENKIPRIKEVKGHTPLECLWGY